MKIKLLLAPSLVVATIILLIWVVYPAYTSPIDNSGLSEKYYQLKSEQEKLSTIDLKISNSKSLVSQISSKRESSDFLMGYIPSENKEEEIIDTLNYLSQSNGLFVLNISVSQIKDSVTGLANTPVDSLDASGQAVPKVVKVFPTNIETRLSVSGDYAQIKEFIVKVNSLPRLNKVVSATLAPITGSDSEQKSSILKLDMVLNFLALKLASNPVNADDPVFLSGSFDMKSIEDIQQTRQGGSLKLDVGQIGVTNPFLP